MASELAARDFALWKFSRKFRPDVLAAIGGIWAAQVGWVLRKPSVIFYDTETAHLQNSLTYPFATRIVVPNCYQGKLPEHKTIRYSGYHELSYLHPRYFSPCKQIALQNGLDPERDNFLVRMVSWKASHDINLKGWSNAMLLTLVAYLERRGNVILSAEGPLPEALERLRYKGDTSSVHHVMAFCRACIGESATMASEAVVLGVPAVYAATESRGYVDEQAQRFGLGSIVPDLQTGPVIKSIEQILQIDQDQIKARHKRMLEETVDVAALITGQLTEIGGKH